MVLSRFNLRLGTYYAVTFRLDMIPFQNEIVVRFTYAGEHDKWRDVSPLRDLLSPRAPELYACAWFRGIISRDEPWHIAQMYLRMHGHILGIIFAWYTYIHIYIYVGEFVPYKIYSLSPEILVLNTIIVEDAHFCIGLSIFYSIGFNLD